MFNFRSNKKHFSLDSTELKKTKQFYDKNVALAGIAKDKRVSIANSININDSPSPISSPGLTESTKKSSGTLESLKEETVPQSTRSLQATPVTTSRPFEKKEKLQCMFCGGKGCKHENYLNNKNSVIKGLDSDWIIDDMLAMQRPSSRLIKEFDIIQQFKNHGIQTILNVQEPGEHPYCGDGIHEKSGFSYFPEEFSDHGIYFYTLGWKDLAATEFSHMIKIMDIMSFSLQNGKKVAVHCHAGRGRTILVIGSWMIYHHGMSAKDVIAHCSAKREGVLSKEKQKKFLYEFEKYLVKTKRIFHDIPSQTLPDLIKSQKAFINSEKIQQTRYSPLVLCEVVQKLETMINSNQTDAKKLMKAFLNVDDLSFSSGWNTQQEEILKQLKDELNRMNYKALEAVSDPRIVCQLLLDFFENLALPSLHHNILFKIEGVLEDAEDGSGIDEEAIYSLLPRIEFYLLQKISSILAMINKKDPSTSGFNSQFGMRIGISLLVLRKKYDSSFLGRNLETTEIDSAHVNCIRDLVVMFASKDSKELETSYKNSTNTIMNKSGNNSSRGSSEFSSPSMSPTKLSRFAVRRDDVKSPSEFGGIQTSIAEY